MEVEGLKPLSIVSSPSLFFVGRFKKRGFNEDERLQRAQGGVEASIKQRMDACLLMSYKFRCEMEAK